MTRNLEGDGTPAGKKPILLFFTSRSSGQSRRVEGYLAQVLQRRHNHDTFRLHAVEQQERPDLLQRFGVEQTPTLVVVEGKRVVSRLERPRGAAEIQSFLAPWLR